MGNNKFDIFTFQMSPIPVTQLSIWQKTWDKNELMERKNTLFNEVLQEPLNFYHRRNKLNYKIEYSSPDFILLRLANKRTVQIEKQFHRESFESEPSCLVAIYNHPEIQIIAIESDKVSFINSITVKTLLERTFSRVLFTHNLRFSINPMYEEKDFWNILRQYEFQIETLRFEFDYPNLPRVNDNLSQELKEASKSLCSTKTKVEFNASKGSILENLNSENPELNGLVKAHASGAGPVKLKLKNYRRIISTANKVKYIEFEELEAEAPDWEIDNFVKVLKGLLKND